MAEESKAPTTPVEVQAPKNTTNKLVIIIGAVTLVVFIIVVVIGAVMITQLRSTIHTIDAIKKVSQAQSTNQPAHYDTAGGGTGHEGTAAKPNAYIDLDTTTVNLKSENGVSSVLQLKMALTTADEKIADVIKKRLPEIRSRLIMLLSTYTSATLETEKGKQALSDNITIAINQILEPQSTNVQKAMRELQKPDPDSEVLRNIKMSLPVKDVLFSSFFIQ